MRKIGNEYTLTLFLKNSEVFPGKKFIKNLEQLLSHTVRQDDLNALENVLNHIYNLIRATFTRLVMRKEVTGVVSNFYSVWRNGEGMEIISKRTYLRGAVRNRCLDYLHAAKDFWPLNGAVHSDDNSGKLKLLFFNNGYKKSF